MKGMKFSTTSFFTSFFHVIFVRFFLLSDINSAFLGFSIFPNLYINYKYTHVQIHINNTQLNVYKYTYPST
ncbi:hypothetical protein T492DRAFT_1001455 [Pavlovales sp. CCMP2436]|nr:hypothetical protein T492DRAFT_1001455 [Pavlovales sp. CCMP2436]